jgi:hypothetical protein
MNINGDSNIQIGNNISYKKGNKTKSWQDSIPVFFVIGVMILVVGSLLYLYITKQLGISH